MFDLSGLLTMALLASGQGQDPASAATSQPALDRPMVISRVDRTVGGWHSTTRGTIRLVFVQAGRWLVFRGGPSAYHFSDDGVTWTPAIEAPQASRSHIVRGQRIISRYDVLVKGAPDWIFDRFIAGGTISAQTITWDRPHKLDMRLSYYPDLQQDSLGYYTMTGRAVLRDANGKITGEEVLWSRSVRPNDYSQWLPEVRCINHTGDPPNRRGVGSTVHENVPVEDGKSYVLAMMTVEGVGKLFGNLYDGRSWGKQDFEIATDMSTVRGSDKRMCAAWEPAGRKLHVAYVDHQGRLFYRTCRSPYGPQNWSPAVQVVPDRTFCAVLSLDRSKRPAHVYICYGKTLYLDRRDQRRETGQLYLIRSDGRSWSQPLLVSEPGTRFNWYPNMNEHVGRNIGILYLKGGPDQKSKKPVMDIMFASTGRPG